MAENEIIDTHSEEVADILGKIPSMIIRWGLMLLFSILLGVLGVAFMIPQPETISCGVILTTEKPPARIVSSTGGIIEKVVVAEGDFVRKGTAVAWMVNNASIADIEKVRNILAEALIANDLPVPASLSLGEIQNPYVTFYNAAQLQRLTATQVQNPDKLELIQGQLDRQVEILENFKNQLQIKSAEFRFLTNNFRRDSALYHSKKYGISLTEYENAVQNYLSEKASHLAFTATVKSAEQNVITLRQTLLSTHDSQQSSRLSAMIQYEEAKAELISQLSAWSDRYLFRAPIDGHVTFTTIWAANQSVSPGERIATVVPAESNILIKAFVPLTRFGSVRAGQDVNISLDGFPRMQFGMLKGKIQKLSLVPEEEGYAAEIILPNGMTSTYHERLKFIQEMKGTGEILISNTTLLEKIFPLMKYAKQ